MIQKKKPVSKKKTTISKSDKTADSTALSQHRLSALVNSMADAVVAIDEKGKIAVYNGAALDLFDVNIDLSNKKISQITKIIDKDSKPVDIEMLILQTKIQTTNRDMRLVYADDSVINIYVSIAPVRVGYGESDSGGFVVLMRDITKEKSLEEERDEFISVVSHEL